MGYSPHRCIMALRGPEVELGSSGPFVWNASLIRIAARRDRVHFQMSALEVQSVRRCISVSAFARLSHWLEAARRIAASRSFVGMRS